jgi:hypothetical protein
VKEVFTTHSLASSLRIGVVMRAHLTNFDAAPSIVTMAGEYPREAA